MEPVSPALSSGGGLSSATVGVRASPSCLCSAEPAVPTKPPVGSQLLCGAGVPFPRAPEVARGCSVELDDGHLFWLFISLGKSQRFALSPTVLPAPASPTPPRRLRVAGLPAAQAGECSARPGGPACVVRGPHRRPYPKEVPNLQGGSEPAEPEVNQGISTSSWFYCTNACVRAHT